MKLYDANGMIGAYVRERVPIADESQFIRLAESVGIEKSVVYHADARSLNPVFGNEKLIGICRDNPQIEPCFVLSPHYKYEKGWAHMERLLADNDVRFVRLFPKEHGYTLASVHTAEMLEIAGKLNLNVMLNYGSIYSDLGEDPYFEELCRKYGHIRFILTEAPHLRNMMWYGYLEQHSNVHIEMSINDNWLTYERTVGLFGSERLLWGSNMPFNHPGPSITMLAYADISEADKANISHKNLQRLIGRD